MLKLLQFQGNIAIKSKARTYLSFKVANKLSSLVYLITESNHQKYTH